MVGTPQRLRRLIVASALYAALSCARTFRVSSATSSSPSPGMSSRSIGGSAGSRPSAWYVTQKFHVCETTNSCGAPTGHRHPGAAHSAVGGSRCLLRISQADVPVDHPTAAM
eukprot:7285225-Prymnesium_polylepis.3